MKSQIAWLAFAVVASNVALASSATHPIDGASRERAEAFDIGGMRPPQLGVQDIGGMRPPQF